MGIPFSTVVFLGSRGLMCSSRSLGGWFRKGKFFCHYDVFLYF